MRDASLGDEFGEVSQSWPRPNERVASAARGRRTTRRRRLFATGRIGPSGLATPTLGLLRDRGGSRRPLAFTCTNLCQSARKRAPIPRSGASDLGFALAPRAGSGFSRVPAPDPLAVRQHVLSRVPSDGGSSATLGGLIVSDGTGWIALRPAGLPWLRALSGVVTHNARRLEA